MKSLQQLRTAAILKALKEQDLTNKEIIQLVKDEGWTAVQSLAEEVK